MEDHHYPKQVARRIAHRNNGYVHVTISDHLFMDGETFATWLGELGGSSACHFYVSVFGSGGMSVGVDLAESELETAKPPSDC